MNSINYFSTIPAGIQLSIISEADEGNPTIDIALVCKAWHILLNDPDNPFSCLSNEVLEHIFFFATKLDPTELPKIALVCKKWKTVQQVNSLWRPVLNRWIKVYKYDIDLSTEKTYKEQLISYKENRLNDFKALLIEIAIKLEKSESSLPKLTLLEAKYFLDKIYHTDLFIQLIRKEEFTNLFKIILCKPRFNLLELFSYMKSYHCYYHSKCRESNMLISLLIKLNYNIHNIHNDFFVMHKPQGYNHANGIAMFALSTSLLGQFKGIKVADFIASGIIFNYPEKTDPRVSVLKEFLPYFKDFYETGTFQSSLDCRNICFDSDEKLKKYLRMAPCSEEELKDFIFDLLTIADLNLNRFCSPWGNFTWGNFEAGTALSQLRQLAQVLPVGNAAARALKEFDQITMIRT